MLKKYNLFKIPSFLQTFDQNFKFFSDLVKIQSFFKSSQILGSFRLF